MSCLHCHESARFVEYRPKTVQSTVGAFTRDRAYYHCRSCGTGTIPWDGILGLSRQALSPGARELICVAGAVDSFGEAADVVLKKLAGLRALESTVERTGEAAGRDIGRRLAAGETFGTAEPWAWHTDAEGKTCAYVSLDLAGLGMQGPGGVAVEGRMAAVGMVYNSMPEDPARRRGRTPQFQARYVAGLGGQASLAEPMRRQAASLAEPLRRQAAQVGMDRAERWIDLSDGGSGLESWMRANFGRVVEVILDFYHAAEHLGDLAKALHPGAEDARETWLGDWCGRLKHESGAAVLEDLRGLEVRGRAARKVRAEVARCFGNQVHRMDYPYAVCEFLGS